MRPFLLRNWVPTPCARPPPPKYNLPLVGHVQWVQYSTSIYIRKVAFSVHKELRATNGKDSAPQKNCLLLERTSKMAVSKVCTPSPKSFIVKRLLGSKVRDVTNQFCSTPRQPYMTIWFYKLLILVLRYQHFSSHPPHFSAAEISRTTLLRYTSWLNNNCELVNAGNSSNFHISE